MLVESCDQEPGSQVDKAWQLVSEVFKYHPELLIDNSKQLHIELRKLTVEAWSARLAMLRKHKLPEAPATSVVLMLQGQLLLGQYSQNNVVSNTSIAFGDSEEPTFDSGLAAEDDVLDWDHWVNLV